MSAEERAADLPHAGEEFSGGGIDVVGVVVALLREWRLGLIVAAVTAIVCFAVIFSLKKEYVATATFLPHEGRTQSDSLASILSYHGPSTLYIGMLKSRFIENAVIQTVGAQQAFGTSDLESARAVLEAKSTFTESTDNIVTIAVRDRSAKMAAAIANAYLKALGELNESMGRSETASTRDFFQGQLEQERNDLEQAEEKLAGAEEKTGLIQPETQAGISLSTIAQLRSQMTALQVQLASLQQYETDANPEVQRVKSEISRLQAEESALEGSGSKPIGAAPSAGQLPAATMNMKRAQRDVQYHNQLVTSLASQYESAHLAEQFARPGFQVIDPAIVPEHQAWPPRIPFALAALAFSLLLGLFAVVLKLLGGRILADPANKQHMASLREIFGKS